MTKNYYKLLEAMHPAEASQSPPLQDRINGATHVTENWHIPSHQRQDSNILKNKNKKIFWFQGDKNMRYQMCKECVMDLRKRCYTGLLMRNIHRAALFQKSVQTRLNCSLALCVSVHERPEVSVIFPCGSWLYSVI